MYMYFCLWSSENPSFQVITNEQECNENGTHLTVPVYECKEQTLSYMWATKPATVWSIGLCDMISETSSLQRSGKVAGEVSKEIEAEMNAIKEVAVANNRTTDVAEPEDYDTDLEEESRPQHFTNFCYLPPFERYGRKIFYYPIISRSFTYYNIQFYW